MVNYLDYREVGGLELFAGNYFRTGNHYSEMCLSKAFFHLSTDFHFFSSQFETN